MAKRKRNRVYMVVNEKGYNFGAFPFTKDGKEKALKYIKGMKKKSAEKLRISS